MATFACDTCGREFDDGIDAGQHEIWHARKREGDRTAELLGALPTGSEFRLTDCRAAYVAVYRKNEAGLFDQVAGAARPYVVNMDAAHIGFCVGYAAVASAVAS